MAFAVICDGCGKSSADRHPPWATIQSTRFHADGDNPIYHACSRECAAVVMQALIQPTLTIGGAIFKQMRDSKPLDW